MFTAATAIVLLSAITATPAPVEDYTFGYWMDGWKQETAQGEKRFCVQTNHYAFCIDVNTGRILHLGEIANPLPYEEAVACPDFQIQPQHAASLNYSYRVNDANTPFEVSSSGDFRLIESGRFMQRFDMPMTLTAPGVETALRLEITAWPDKIVFDSVITPFHPPDDVGKVTLISKLNYNSTYHLANSRKPTIPLVNASAPEGRRETLFDTDETYIVNCWVAPYGVEKVIPRTFEIGRYCQKFYLPNEQWQLPEALNRLERYRVVIHNKQDKPKTYPITFAKEGPFSGITGMTPMLRDKNGEPTGIPVQISKNWHRKEGETHLYEGPWFRGSTFITLAPKERWEGEFCITYGQWGGVPAASHAQLCLIGWGVNQLWDQVAIGSWGESICYDPDINLNRSRIDDVRPLLVRNMGSDINKHGWTVNVGGGDFLVYEQEGQRVPMKRMRTAYLDYGPNLTDVIYAGITQDEAIEAQFRVSTPRCDDINRAYHRIRYDVKKETTFDRLAFYQLGADNYNDHQFGKISRGNGTAGHLETFDAPQGGKVYHRTGILCDGQDAWFSLHESVRNTHHPKGAWANRGMIIRSWKARLGGKDIPHPYAAIFGTDNGYPSANVELAPPPGLTTLLPGDFVEAEIELVIFPQFADDYFGPNENLRVFLAKHPNSWEPVHREAAGNRLDITMEGGTLQRNYPVEIAVDATDKARFSIAGGIGYVPVTLHCLHGPTSPKLWELIDGKEVRVDQSVHGNDFWQCGYDSVSKTWRVTFNLPLDSDEDARQPRHFRFHR